MDTFTFVEYRSRYKEWNLNNNKKNRYTINNNLDDNEMNDIWRILNPYSKHYTWHSNIKPTLICRFD